MSRTNLSISNKGIQVIDSSQAWLRTRNGKRQYKLNPNFNFVGKVVSSFPNMIVTASDNVQPSFKGDVSNLNRVTKNKLIKHFFDSTGKRNRKTIAYLVTKK